MNVVFSCSTDKLKEYKEQYRLICCTIKELGHTLVRDWIEEAIGSVEGRTKKIDRQTIYKKVLKAVEKADVVVVEGTVGSFSVGHEATLALQKEKPILFLVNSSAKEKSFLHDYFIDAAKPSLVMKAEYNTSNAKSILEKFFTLYKGGGQFRFNLMLDKDVRDYLNWASRFYQKTKSDIIRDLVRTEALKNNDYTKGI